jgi:hypothetical protein
MNSWRDVRLSRYVSLVATVAIGATVFFVGRPHTVDVVYLITGNTFAHSPAAVTKVFLKYNDGGEYIKDWREYSTDTTIEWDSCWIYYLTFRCRSKLSTPLRLDSIWITDIHSDEPIFTCSLYNRVVQGYEDYHRSVDLKHGFLDVSGPERKHDSLLDSLVESRFRGRAFGYRLFGSGGSWELVPHQYITVRTDLNTRDTVWVE